MLKVWLKTCFTLAYLLFVFPFNGLSCPNANSSLDTAWYQFKIEYKKIYSKNEDCHRRDVWQLNSRIILEHNVEADKGKHTYWMGMNEHGDRTNDEILMMYLGGHSPSVSFSSYFKTHNEPRLDHPRSTSRQVDWRERGCNISANDQQPCGSCYIFSAMAVLECHHAIKNAVGNYERQKISQRLSVQQTIDCANRSMFLMDGCNGGVSLDVYFYEIVQQKKGIFDGFVADSCYPYTGIDRGEKCSTNLIKECKHRVHVKNVKFQPRKESDIQEMIDKNGPAIVSMTVLPATFRWYKRGVYSDSKCSYYNSNHAVALWGYGGGKSNSNGPRYWIIKNSFGSSWGENGFAKMSRDGYINCNLESNFVQPEV